MREIKFSFMWADGKSWMDLKYTLDEIIGGDPYDDMSDQPLLKGFKHVLTREFIGYVDMTGKEVYTDDILDFCEEEWGGKFKPEVVTVDTLFKWTMNGSTSDIGQFRKVIGNIHQHPELLEGGDS